MELWINKGSADANKPFFDRLHARQAEIELAFGGHLEWARLDGNDASRIDATIPGGGWQSNESQWPQIQDAMINAMICFEKALRPYLDMLKDEDDQASRGH